MLCFIFRVGYVWYVCDCQLLVNWQYAKVISVDCDNKLFSSMVRGKSQKLLLWKCSMRRRHHYQSISWRLSSENDFAVVPHSNAMECNQWTGNEIFSNTLFLFQKQQKTRKNKKIFRIIYPNTRVCWLGCHIFPAIIIFQLERTHVQVEIKERKKQGGEVIWNNSIQIVRALIQLSFWYTLPFCWNHNKVVVLIHIRYSMLSIWH